MIQSGIPIGNETIHAEGGRCSERCQWQWVFMLIAVGLLTLMFAAVIPAWTATMRYDFTMSFMSVALHGAEMVKFISPF